MRAQVFHDQFSEHRVPVRFSERLHQTPQRGRTIAQRAAFAAAHIANAHHPVPIS